MTGADYAKWTMAALADELEQRGESKTGKKQELVERLEALEPRQGKKRERSENEENLLNDLECPVCLSPLALELSPLALERLLSRFSSVSERSRFFAQVCLSPTMPPFEQCRNGHIICGDCKPSLEGKCCLCRVSISSGLARNLMMEKVRRICHGGLGPRTRQTPGRSATHTCEPRLGQVVSTLMVECPHGCGAEVPYDSRAHSETCLFAPIACSCAPPPPVPEAWSALAAFRPCPLRALGPCGRCSQDQSGARRAEADAQVWLQGLCRCTECAHARGAREGGGWLHEDNTGHVPVDGHFQDLEWHHPASK